jgi:hypothetical protein
VCGVSVTKYFKNNDFENGRILRKATVQSGLSVGLCESELIWEIENLGKQVPNDGFWSVAN